MQSLKDFVEKKYVYNRLKIFTNSTAYFTIIDLETQKVEIQ
jgi:hypothetical protein